MCVTVAVVGDTYRRINILYVLYHSYCHARQAFPAEYKNATSYNFRTDNANECGTQITEIREKEKCRKNYKDKLYTCTVF